MIFFVGYYGFQNAGDEAILEAMLEQFRARRGDLRLVVASGNPERTAAEHRVEAIPWNDMAAILNAVRHARLVVIGGGGLFHDYWGSDPDTFLTEQHWGVVYYAGPAVLATLYRKPVMIYGVGVGPLETQYGVQFTRITCQSASAITVRDQASKATLESMGIPAADIRVTADPAFTYEPASTSTLEEAVEPEFALRRPVLAVAPRRWDVGVHPDFLERELAASLDYFLKHTEGSVILVPFQDLSGEKEDDRATAGRILAQMRFRERATITRGPASTDQIFCWLRESDVVLGMRLHALIFAALGRVPAVALNYDPKVGELASRVGLEQFDVKNIDGAILGPRLVEACGRTVPSVEALRQEAAVNASIAFQLFDQLTSERQPRTFDLFGAPLVQRENESLRKEKSAISAELTRAAEYCRGLERSLDGYAGTLNATRNGVEEYQTVLRSELTLWRNQRAWQIMLLIRKAYTLWRRSKGAFLGWALGLPFGRIGSLAEQDLVLPDVAGYIPAAPVAPQQDAAFQGPPATSHYDIIIFAIIDFDFRFQRPQQIAAEFARRGHRVFWVSPTRFLPPDSKEAYTVLPLRDNLWEIHLRSRQPDIYMGELQADHVESMSAALGEFCRDWTVAEHAVLIQLPFWRRLALELRDTAGSKLVYDCMDDWETFQNMGTFNIAEEKQLVRETDVLVVTGAELEKKFEAQGLRPVLARNGADYAFFAKATPNHLLDGMPRPVIGYFGAIADWIDLDLVYEVARRRPQYSFVLIGQVFGRDVSALESLGNVRLLGNKPYTDIPAYLHGFDACLIPFLLNQVTKATDPVKLYEYFSLGKPVVATDMKELGQCGDLIYIGQDAEGFAAKVDLAVAEKSSDLVQRRIEFAKANTWGSRVDQIDGAVRETFPLVSILIITYNSASFVRPCLDSLLENTSWPRYEVILVDNASSDQSAALVQEYAERDSRLRLIRVDQNLGFAGGNNRAAHEAHGDYLIFLNIDTMVTGGWIGRLVRHFERDLSMGLLCPVTNFAGNEVKINVNYSCRREMDQFARRLAAEKSGEHIEIPVAPLYCAMMPRNVWDRVGEMDTRYGIGMFEDDDLSLRVHQAGFKIATAEDCFIHHFGQGSFAKLDSDAYNRLFDANRRKFEEKWKQPWVVHRTRPGVKPPLEERRFDPASFVAGVGLGIAGGK